jgi:hypothetical protein
MLPHFKDQKTSIFLTMGYNGRMKYRRNHRKKHPWEFRETSPYSHECSCYVSPDDYQDFNFQNKGQSYDRNEYDRA